MNIVPLAEAADPLLYGGKAASLCLAVRHSLPVPTGYVLPKFVVSEFAEGHLTDELHAVIREHKAVAVRSSAIGEDGETSSYAGQLRSYLNVTSVSGMQKAICDVRASATSKSVKAYRAQSGLSSHPLEVAILIQQMIPSDVSGIMFTCNPVNGEDERVIEAARGLGEAIASGYVTPDFYRVRRNGEIVDQTIGDQDAIVNYDHSGSIANVKSSGGCANSLCLNALQLQELLNLASACEHVYGSHRLDIEWAFYGGKFFLLQCRSITGLNT